MSKPKLYQYAVCPFCWKVRVGLSLKQADYQTIEVHPLNKKEISFSADWKKVPIWVNQSGAQINDSTVILKQLDTDYPDNPIFQNDDNESRWLKWSEDYVGSLPTVIYNGFGNSLKAFDYITQEGNFSFLQRRVIKYSGAGIMHMVAKKIKKRLNIEDPDTHVLNLMQEWADSLQATFQGGEKPNASDVAVFGFTLSPKRTPKRKPHPYAITISRVVPGHGESGSGTQLRNFNIVGQSRDAYEKHVKTKLSMVLKYSGSWDRYLVASLLRWRVHREIKRKN